MKHFYAVFSNHGMVSTGDGYGQPKLHVFYTKKEREDFIEKNDCKDGNINNRAWEVSARQAISSYSNICNGTREYFNTVIH